jgi:CDP-diacylglycerol--serine O-phosphatidyltransferase
MNGAERPARRGRLPDGLTLRAMVPNAITAGALCVGLTGIRFGIDGEFAKAVLFVIVAGMLDGIDGRIARMLNAQSRFGAELDSLADSINFGVAPALILYLWSLQETPRLGWFAALAFAICCVLRLARFNARIDLADQPMKSAGFLTGVPAPVGAGLAFLPLYLWIVTDLNLFRDPMVVGIWLAIVAFLLISAVPTLAWSRLAPRRSWRLPFIVVVALVVAGLVNEPWWTLVVICLGYLALIPMGLVAYARVRRRRAVPAEVPGGTEERPPSP